MIAIEVLFGSSMSNRDKYIKVPLFFRVVKLGDDVFFSGDKIASCHTRKRYEVTEVGIMHPEQVQTDLLNAGQVGYLACNMKDPLEGEILDFCYISFPDV